MSDFLRITRKLLAEMHQRQTRREKLRNIRTTVEQGRLLPENLIVKRDTANNRLVVQSDKDTPNARAKETIALSKEFRKIGLDFDRSLGMWVGDINKFDVIKQFITQHNAKTPSADPTAKALDTLEDLEDFIQDADVPSTDKTTILDKLDAYIDELANATDQAAMDQAITKYLDFYKKFYKYSWTNSWLIFLQRPDAKQVAGFNKWKTMHRVVKKGAKAIWIIAPIVTKAKGKDATSDDYSDVDDAIKNKTQIRGFRPVPVFDIADTEATSAKGEIPDEPKWFSDNTPDEVAAQLTERLKEFAQLNNITITKEASRGGEKGFSAGGHINLSSDVQGVGEASTLVHEIAHELLHWKKSSIFHIDDEESNTRAMKELQAESVAYAVMKYYEFDVKHQPTYLALWKANKDLIKKNLNIITKCARYIIDGVDSLKS